MHKDEANASAESIIKHFQDESVKEEERVAPTRVVDELEPSENVYSEERFKQMVQGKLEYMVCDDGMQSKIADKMDFDEIVKEGEELRKQGFFKAAGVGKDEKHQTDKKIRNDLNCFIGPAGGMKKEQVAKTQSYIEKARTHIYEAYNALVPE
jgi:hypothetical protein